MKTFLLIFLLLTVIPAFLTGVRGALPPGHESDHESPYETERYDSLLSQWYQTGQVDVYEKYFQDFIELESDDCLPGLQVDQIPDSVYESRLRMIASVIQLPYNKIVRKYIVAYTGRLKERMQQMLGLAQYYFPFIEEELDRQGLPGELKILPMIESALQPRAVSRAGATGIWQFMYRTGKGMGLEINSFVDERMDPEASTRAACRYLGQLYAIYGDWTLAVAAYNCGPGNVNKALKRVPNARNYWDIYEWLPRETRGYVPSFIAATYAYTFHKAHDMEPVLPTHPIHTDTIQVRKMLHFEQISTTLDVPLETLRALNPQYKLDIIPALDKPYSLVLPTRSVTEYIALEPEILAKDTLYLAKYVKPDNLDPRKMLSASFSESTYRVKKGDILGSIARKHGVSVTALMRANNLSESAARRLRIGQTLRIPR